MVARNFYSGSMNIFKPEIDIFPWATFEPEFPIYQWTVAVFYRIFGLHESLGRLFSILCGLGTIMFLYLLIKSLFNTRVALLGGAFYAVCPLVVYHDRTFMPESLMLMLSVGGIFFFYRRLKTNNITFWVLSVLFIAGAFLVKITSLFLIFPILFMAVQKYQKKIFRQWDFLLFLIFIILPAFLWYYFPHREIALTMRGSSIWKIGADKWFNRDIFFNPDFYVKIFLYYHFDLIMGFVGIPFFFIGLFKKPENREQKLFRIWLGSALLYVFVVAVGNYVHEYYHVHFVPVIALFSALGVEKYLQKKHKLITNLIITLLLALLPLYSLLGRAARWRKPNLIYKSVAEEVKKISKADDYIIVADTSEPEILYYSERKGWHIDSRWQTEEMIEKYKKMGAKYYTTFRLGDFGNISNYMQKNNLPVRKTADFVIYELVKGNNN
jgi:4-amino-4-deoxy-L-arabinose transferase-like glycosyltransferase